MKQPTTLEEFIEDVESKVAHFNKLYPELPVSKTTLDKPFIYWEANRRFNYYQLFQKDKEIAELKEEIERLKGLSVLIPITGTIIKASESLGVINTNIYSTDWLRGLYDSSIHFNCKDGDEAFSDGYVLWLESNLMIDKKEIKELKKEVEHSEDHYDNISHQLNIAHKKIEELKKEVERLSIKFHDPELNKPNPNKDDISFSEDVFTIDETGLIGCAYYDFDLCQWSFHTEQMDDSKFKWFYPPKQH